MLQRLCWKETKKPLRWLSNVWPKDTVVERVGGLLRCNTPLDVILVNMLATGTTDTYSSVAVQANATIRTSYSLRGLCHSTSTTELEFSQIAQTGSREGFFTGDTEASTMAINHVVDRSCIHRR